MEDREVGVRPKLLDDEGRAIPTGAKRSGGTCGSFPGTHTPSRGRQESVCGDRSNDVSASAGDCQLTVVKGEMGAARCGYS
jgi:hypothetical protein